MAPMAANIVLKLDLHDSKDKQKALKVVSTLHGIDSLSLDMKDGKMTVIGPVDPVDVVTKLRKNGWPSAQIISIGAWPEKKDGGGDKKDGGGAGKKDAGGGDKKDASKPPLVSSYPPPQWYAQQQPTYYYQQQEQNYPQYGVHSAEDDPNSCVIC